MDQVFIKENKRLKKILENWKKILEKSGNFVSPEKWEPCETHDWLSTAAERIFLKMLLLI